MSMTEDCLCSITESLRVLADMAELSKRDREFLPVFTVTGVLCGYTEYGTGRVLVVEKSPPDKWRVQLTVTTGSPRFWILSPPMTIELAMVELEKIKTRLEKSGE